MLTLKNLVTCFVVANTFGVLILQFPQRVRQVGMAEYRFYLLYDIIYLR